MTFPKSLLLMAFAAAACSFPCLAAVEEEIPVKAVKGFVMVGGVNARNGNYSLTYPAFESDDGVRYRRTYNSLSENRGVFGRGWGAVFDTQLIQLPDGRVVIRENGNGAMVLYGEPHPDETLAATERLLLAAEAAGPPSVAYVKDGDTLLLDPGKALAASACGEAKISRRGDRWVRGVCDNEVQMFDRNGRLTWYWKDGYRVKIHRRFSKIRSISDNFGNKLRFRYSRDGLRVTSPKGGWYSYDFDSAGYNIRSDSPRSGPLVYSYNADHKLIDVRYMDTTHVQIEYDKNDRVSRTIDREGGSISFDYLTEDDRPTTLVTWASKGAIQRIKYRFADASDDPRIAGKPAAVRPVK